METTATSLKAAGEVISDDGLLIAMTLKGLATNYKPFSTVVMQREQQITFSEFKIALCNHKENERCCSKDNGETTDGVMATTSDAHKPNKFLVKCSKCGRKGQRSAECYSKKVGHKWCQRCRHNSHNTKDCQKGTISETLSKTHTAT